jgi:hypothetical protein
MSGPSEVKSVPEPAGKQLELPAPLLELLEVPPVEEPPPSSPDPELDVPLDDAPVSPLASSAPELVELEVADELELPLLVPPLPDEVGSKPLEPLDPPDPLDPN